MSQCEDQDERESVLQYRKIMRYFPLQVKRNFLFRFLKRNFFALCLLFALPLSPAHAQMELPQEALADLVKPSVVRIALHVKGNARIPAVKVDIKQRLIAVVPNSFTEVPVDEYLTGSGFIIHPDGFIATNAHVVSEGTVKVGLASESALSAMFQNALFLSDDEMEQFLESASGEEFTRHVLNYVIEKSTFRFSSELAVLRPDSEEAPIADLLSEGFPAKIVSVNESFATDERDVAILKIEERNLPALKLGTSENLSVGTRAFILGFPASAEVNENNPAEATFTGGLVSALKQSSDKSFKLFQTDAKVSQGSSGGPLFDDQGEVVGMITFQTDGLARETGDNFAFALPIELVKTAALEARVPFVEGAYGENFKQGFFLYAEKHCDRALEYFNRAKEANALFLPGLYVDPYVKKCEDLKLSGLSLDSTWDEIGGGIRNLGNPFFYLLGGGLFLFSIFGAALFWLLRQLRREEKEIELLQRRLRADEKKFHSPPPGPRV